VTDDIWALGEQVRVSIQTVIDRACAEGPLRPGVTAADVCVLLQQLSPSRRAAPERGVRYLALMLDGLCGKEPLPGEGVTWQEGELLWRTAESG
jgi:hypothetical protein